MVRKRIPNLPAFTSDRPNLDPGSNLKAQTPTTPVSKRKTISSSQYKTIFLHDWWLVKPQGKGLAVGGVASMERLGERVIFSSPIAKRHETNVLETQDGITFIITGFINKSRTCENGFSFEVCRHFLFGFPHDWEEYMANGFGEDHNNGNTGLDDPSSCPLKSAGDALPFIIHNNVQVSEIPDLLTNEGDLNCCLLLNKFFNNAIGTSPENVSEQSDHANNMECNITKNTKKCQGKEDTSLKTSQIQDDQMHNTENGVSDVIPETQDENPSLGFESVMEMNFPKPCRGLPANNMECDITMNTTESVGKEDTSFKTSQVQDDQMHNIENGGSDVILETQVETPRLGFESGVTMNSLKQRGGLPEKRTDKSPGSSEKKKNEPRSSVRKQKIPEDVDNYECRRITRSISKMSSQVRRYQRTMTSEDDGNYDCRRVTRRISKMSSPVRRSPRLCNLKYGHTMTDK